ncbi:MAG: AMP-binding protein, partial [Lachnospiraceae bacterium]|nr:AMP-binding protein [Lachnospiraceae bacterium]
MGYLETVENNVKLYGSRLAATLDFNEEPMTYSELWDISGRTYRFLKEQGIGKEDFVLIKLPRGPKPMAVILGVFRAGAAFTIVEDIYPEDRIAYIEKDCGCRLRIDLDAYDKILKTEPLEGFEKTDPHDACFAIYTSGTTGNPKGVLHEYGKLDYAVKSVPKEFEKKEESVEKFAAIMPMNFVAFLFVITTFFYNGDTAYVVSFAVAKNFVRYTQLLEQEQITECFMSPSMIRVYKNPADSLKIIATGSEPANGIFYGKPAIYNIYAMSESGMAIAGFLIDKPYDKAPVGRNTTGSKVVILGEDGQELPDGQEGEICFENAYFRGYIHLPEETEKAFRGGIFHTGDLGYMDENGNLLISGRSDDMIKINGNRIEPAEIEAAAKDILHVQNAVAKGFDEDGSAFVALYCLKSEVGDKFDEGKTDGIRREMENRLPHYMIPSYFVALDELPINPNGKVVRKMLKSPRAAALKREYVEPENDTEKKICSQMAKVLGLEKVGATEDFFYLGGDSLKTIQLVSGLEELGVFLTAENIYDGRSAEKIAKLAASSSAMTEEEWEKAEKEAEGMQLELLHGQWQMIQYLSCCEHASSALNTAMKLQKGVDAERLQEAADRVLSAHPALRTRLILHEDGTYTQQYDESLYDGVPVFEMKEEEAEDAIRKMTDRYGLLDQRMSYSAVVRTPESVYFVLLLNHVIMDGEGQKLLLNQIYKAYQSRDYRPEKDYYFAILKNTLDRQREKL